MNSITRCQSLPCEYGRTELRGPSVRHDGKVLSVRGGLDRVDREVKGRGGRREGGEERRGQYEDG